MDLFHYFLLFSTTIFIFMYSISLVRHKLETNELKIGETFNLFALDFFISFIPLINIIFFIENIHGLFTAHKTYKLTKKELVLYPENESLKILKEILCLYNAGDYYSEFYETFKKDISILESKLNIDDYKNLLLRYEFTFARIISINKESSNFKEPVRNKILNTSKELLEDFLEEFYILLDKEKDLEDQTEEVISTRFLQELEEEKIIQSRQMKYTKIS